MSRIMSSGPTWSMRLIAAGASAANAPATTTSVGSGISAPRAARARHDAPRGLEQVGLAQRLADRVPGRRDERVRDAAARR
jgi:hypothetical protein